MRRKWQKSIGVVSIRVLQITVIIGIFICVGQIVLGFTPAPDNVDMLALMVLFLLGLIVLALDWLVFELNQIDKE
jgi:hypothetical protein